MNGHAQDLKYDWKRRALSFAFALFWPASILADILIVRHNHVGTGPGQGLLGADTTLEAMAHHAPAASPAGPGLAILSLLFIGVGLRCYRWINSEDHDGWLIAAVACAVMGIFGCLVSCGDVGSFAALGSLLSLPPREFFAQPTWVIGGALMATWALATGSSSVPDLAGAFARRVSEAYESLAMSASRALEGYAHVNDWLAGHVLQR